jgi:hypothetical protein
LECTGTFLLNALIIGLVLLAVSIPNLRPAAAKPNFVHAVLLDFPLARYTISPIMNVWGKPLLRLRLKSPVSRALVIAICLFGQQSMQASPIIYQFNAIGSGSLGGNSFDNAAITITANTDTSQIFTYSPGILHVPNLSATVYIAGLGTATFDNTRDFVNQNTGAGISDGVLGYDILAVATRSIGTYDLSTSIGPLSGQAAFNVGVAFGTTEGDFILTSASSGIFQATIEPVPEPSACMILGFGAVGLLTFKRAKGESRCDPDHTLSPHVGVPH